MAFVLLFEIQNPFSREKWQWPAGADSDLDKSCNIDIKVYPAKMKKSPELLKVTVQYSQGKFPFQWPLTLIITYQIFHGASVQNSEGIMKPWCLSACHLYVTPSFTAALTGL